MQEQRSQVITEWMDRYGDSVLKTIYVIVRDREASEDIAQDVFVRAWRKLHSFRRDSSPGTWLYRIAVNLAKNYLRKNRDLPMGPDQVAIESGPWPGAGPETIAVANSERARVRASVAALGTELRTVVALYYLDDLPVDEVARVLQIPPGTVKSRLARARAAMKVDLVETGDAGKGERNE